MIDPDVVYRMRCRELAQECERLIRDYPRLYCPLLNTLSTARKQLMREGAQGTVLT